jgi:hypothetical protein
MTDVVRLLQEIGAAQDIADLVALERDATHLIEDITARLSDAIRERRDYLNRR